MQSQLSSEETVDDVTSPYFMFKYSIRSELTRKYYERRLRTFFDFINFSKGSEIEKRCNSFRYSYSKKRGLELTFGIKNK
ncbi:MAG: hypothetical protein QN785_07095 [Nitrososphaeraceae archaeon]|nr:hypothetical protein [Nitrososphaeraceae archaeon]